MANLSEDEDDDEFDLAEELHVEPVIAIVGGRIACRLDSLVPLYGRARTILFAQWIGEMFLGHHAETAENKVSAWRRFMIACAQASDAEPAWQELSRCFRDDISAIPSSSLIERALKLALEKLSNLDDASLISSKIDKSRANMWEQVRQMFCLFHTHGYLPPVKVRGTIYVNPNPRTPVLADLARGKGRLRKASSWAEHHSVDAEANLRILAALRHALVKEFETEYEFFKRGKAIAENGPVPTEVDRLLSKDPGDVCLLGEPGSDDHLVSAVRLRWSMIYEAYTPTCPANALAVFFRRAGGRHKLRSFLGATPAAMALAYYIVLIDTGWNMQPCLDLTANPFVGEVRRGHRVLLSIGGKKNRALGKEIEAPLEVSLAQSCNIDEQFEPVQCALPVKGPRGAVSAVRIIEMWLEMTAPIRAHHQGRELALGLWVFRREGSTQISEGTISKMEYHLRDFLVKNAHHAEFGQLEINARVIRKTVANIKSANGVAADALSMALLDHEAESVHRLYFTEATINARYNTLVRIFIELWEAGSVKSIDEAARLMGVAEEDLFKRQQLGVKLGLGFAQIGQATAKEEESEINNNPARVADTARIFVPTGQSLSDLHLARMALIDRETFLAAVNPGRWIRVWLPWKAVLDVLHQKLLASVHRAKYSRAMNEVEKKLLDKKVALPLVF